MCAAGTNFPCLGDQRAYPGTSFPRRPSLLQSQWGKGSCLMSPGGLLPPRGWPLSACSTLQARSCILLPALSCLPSLPPHTRVQTAGGKMQCTREAYLIRTNTIVCASPVFLAFQNCFNSSVARSPENHIKLVITSRPSLFSSAQAPTPWPPGVISNPSSAHRTQFASPIDHSL